MPRLVALVLLLAACGGSVPAATTTKTAISTTTTKAPQPAAASLIDDPAYEAAMRIIDDPGQVTAGLAAARMFESGDVRWVPYLVDLVLLIGLGDAFYQAWGALRELTGEPGPVEPAEVYTFFGGWMYDHGIDPGPGYVEWKARLYGLIDPDFEELIAQIDDAVLASRIQWGGVLRGGIPELNHQRTITVAEASYMQDDELTFAAVINGEARAYPHRILDHHELANDTLGGEPVALADCTLCRTGVLFSRQVGGQVLEFETSGLLLNSNKVMVDRQTNSLWNHLTGVAIAGPLAGTELDRFFLTVTRWGDWVAEHPETDVLAIPELGLSYSYQPGDAYRSYYASERLWFPIFAVPDALDAKTEVATLELDGSRLAVGVDALATAGSQLLQVGDRTVAVVPTSGGARFYDVTGAGDLGDDVAGAVAGELALQLPDGRRFDRVQSGQSFWFAWYGNHPDTAWWPRSS
ncbi:MAG: DUF3179 domain-containing protein [Acidimicrobiia bacterium]